MKMKKPEKQLLGSLTIVGRNKDIKLKLGDSLANGSSKIKIEELSRIGDTRFKIVFSANGNGGKSTVNLFRRKKGKNGELSLDSTSRKKLAKFFSKYKPVAVAV